MPPKGSNWVSLRISEADLLKRVKADLEARFGCRFSYGQVVLVLARQYMDKAKG